MGTRTKITTVSELKEIFIEGILNNSDEVTKVTDKSTLSGIGYGVAKVGQKALKEIALIESRLFLEEASGDQLDQIARDHGLPIRLGSSTSSVFVRIIGTPNTLYQEGINSFTGTHGIVFDLEKDFTIPADGYGYAKLKSQTSGDVSNIKPNTITTVTPVPSGHTYVINETRGVGGRDVESDDLFKQRLYDSLNILSINTLAKVEQSFIKINSNVLKVFYRGINSLSQPVFDVATQNGVDLTTPEIDVLLSKGSKYLSMVDQRPYESQGYGVEIRNITYYPLDIAFRVDLANDADSDVVRKELQIAFSKKNDYRFWSEKEKIEWDDLFEIVKKHPKVKYAPDNYFQINTLFRTDIKIPRDKLPRFRGFVLQDLDGNTLSNSSNTLNPIYYPNNPSKVFQSTISI